jgi:hypothetical protein
VGLSTVSAVSWGILRGRLQSVHQTSDFTVADGIRRTWTLFEEAVAWFGLLETRVRVAILIWLALWIVLAVLAIRRGDRRDHLVLAGLTLVVVTLPIVVSLVQPPPIYTRFHGRYALPLWMGVPILAGTIAATRRGGTGPPARLLWALAGAVGLGHVAAFATAAHRYAVGTNGQVLYFLDTEWAGPVPPLLVLAVVTAAASAFAWRLGLPLPSRTEAPRPVAGG